MIVPTIHLRHDRDFPQAGGLKFFNKINVDGNRGGTAGPREALCPQ